MRKVIEIRADELALGDIIKEKRPIEVEVLHVNPPGCNTHVHVNRRLCYDGFVTLVVSRVVTMAEITAKMAAVELLSLHRAERAISPRALAEID